MRQGPEEKITEKVVKKVDFPLKALYFFDNESSPSNSNFVMSLDNVISFVFLFFKRERTGARGKIAPPQKSGFGF